MNSNALRAREYASELLIPDYRTQATPPRFSKQLIRLVIAGVNVGQAALWGVVLLSLFPNAFEHISNWAAFDLGVVVLFVTEMARFVGRVNPRPGAEFVGLAALRAAGTTVLGVAAAWIVCLFVTSLAARNPSEIAELCVTWAAAAAVSSAILEFGTARLAVRVPPLPRMVIVGPHPSVDNLAFDIARQQPPGWTLAACINDADVDSGNQLRNLVRRDYRSLTVLLIAAPAESERICAEVRDRLADLPVRIWLTTPAGLLNDNLRSPITVAGRPVVEIVPNPFGISGWLTKRSVDVMISLMLLLLVAPVLAAVALMIRFTSPGSILFKQQRVGLGSLPIEVLKFRTMHSVLTDATGACGTTARDPRVTAVGRLLRRTSIDELPQLWNVLRGDMSLVGPRPHPLHMRIVDVYYGDVDERYRARHCVRPGITGWAQINGSRGAVDTIDKARTRVELDLWYLRHWSLLLDLYILLRTVAGGFASFRAD